jgi:hypothetical protein
VLDAGHFLEFFFVSSMPIPLSFFPVVYILSAYFSTVFSLSLQPGAKLQQARLIGASDAVNRRREL